MPPLTRHTLKMVQVKVGFSWRRAGEAYASFQPTDREITAVWMPPVPRRAGLYRISIALSSAGRAVYIGEGVNIASRLQAYARTYAGGSRKKIEERLAPEIKKALLERRKVVIDYATTGRVNLVDLDRPLQMRRVSERRFAESAAVLAEWERDDEGQIIVLNRIIGDDWWLWGRDDEDGVTPS